MAQTKATKKYEKRHLADTLKRRNEHKKIKQRHQLKDKKKARRAAESIKDETGNEESKEPGHDEKTSSENVFENMSVEELFAGGFEAAKPPTKRRDTAKRKRNEDNENNENTGKHKNTSNSDEEDEDELKAHMKELDALSEKDPEFYKYLKENDPDLLDTEKEGQAELELELSADEDDDPKGKNKSKEQEEVTLSLIKRWTQALEKKHSLRVMREVATAFRAAAHLHDKDDKEFRYTITDANGKSNHMIPHPFSTLIDIAYNDLLILCFNQIPSVLNHHIPVKQLSHNRQTVPTESAAFRNSTQLLKSHTSTILHLLPELVDVSATRLALNSLLSLVPYILSFKKLVREVARTVSGIWSSTTLPETTRITAFLVLQSLFKNGDPGIKDSILRLTYQALLKGCRQTNVHTLAAINLMKNSGVDLWATPPSIGSKEKDKEAQNVPYTVAFTLIRALAIHLRNSIKHNANDTYKQVYNWQYVHALDFWSRVLSTHCNTLTEATSGRESLLRPLIYPLTQVTLGALRLIPTAAYFPLRFHCTRTLLRLSSSTNTYIPLAASLLEVLQSAEMRKPPRPSTQKPLDFDVTIRCPQSLLRTRTYQDGAGEQVAELFAEFFGVWSTHIAFPELSVPVIVMLKRWLKDVNPYSARQPTGQDKGNDRQPKKQAKGNRNAKVNSAIVLVVQKIEANSKWVEERRRKVEFSPKDRSQVEAFHKEVEWEKTPMGAFVVGQRRVREERRKVLEEARRAEEQKRGGNEDGSDNEEMEEELEAEIEHDDDIEAESEEDVESD